MTSDDSQLLVPEPTNFMRYPRPILELFETTLTSLKEESRQCIQNLLDYRAPRTHAQFPRGQSAAVLVPLFVGRSGDVYVILSRRSSALREYAGDTALPGGKVDPRDATVEDTARREAFEETGLPQDPERVPLLCVTEPFLAGNQTVVTPVVVLILDKTLQPSLNESEVTSIFAQTLSTFLRTDRSSGDPSKPYYSYVDRPWSRGGSIRVHSFLTGREADGVKPVFGLTANILIRVATIGYGREPTFQVQPPNAPTTAQQIAYALLTPNNPLRIACDKEGMNANKTAARILHPSPVLNAPHIVEWEKIGLDWKRLMERSGGASARETRAVKAPTTGFRSSGRGKFSGRFEGGIPEGIRQRVDGIAKQVKHRVESEGDEKDRMNAKIEEHKKRAAVGKADSEKPTENDNNARDVTDMKTLGEYLDKTRDMVQKRREELLLDEEKLAKARKAYPRVTEEVKKQFSGMRKGNGRIDIKALMAMIPKESVASGGNGLDATKEGWQRESDHNEEREDGVRMGKEGMQKGLEEMKKHILKDGDGHGPEQLIRKKRDAKL
ncbi:NUDIX hydrolase domain-like protein [Pisolithus marmoratus]|nr:NUDIX hydrolase domain-like protein [Pisolithus marmoratus]